MEGGGSALALINLSRLIPFPTGVSLGGPVACPVPLGYKEGKQGGQRM